MDRDHAHILGGIHHRPDIDGLRAIAILSVLGFHAFGRGLSGGFVGVDIFFVISGYLISGILLRGLKEGTFGFSKFYARRIKRIFPALLVVLLALWIAGWYTELPDEYAHLGKHVAGGAGFVSNILLWREAGYFDQRSALKPLLHLWSLGVEEQFYILWPLLLFVAWKCRINLLWMIAAVMLGSFALNVTRVGTHEAATFYLPFTRFWELLVGATYAYWETFIRGSKMQAVPVQTNAPLTTVSRGYDLAACIGLLLIVASVIGLDSTEAFPGWWAVPPVLGSALLIAAGPSAWINRRLLANRPMVFIGLISYPLYLWHWPLLSFNNIVGTEDTSPSITITLLLAAIVLAWLTYEFIERPIRSRPSLGPVAWPLAGAVALIGTVGLLSFHGSIPPRSAKYRLEKIVRASDGGVPFPGSHLKTLDAAASPLWRQGMSSSIVLFMGDSFIEQYYPRVDWLLQNNPTSTKSAVFATNGGCPPIPKVQEDHHAYCLGLVARAIRFANDPNVKTIVIGANWLNYFLQLDSRYSYYVLDGTQKENLQLGSSASALAWNQLLSMVAKFKQSGKQVYLILPSPTDDAFEPRRLIAARWGSRSFEIATPLIGRKAIMQSMAPIVERLRAIAEATGVHVIDPVEYLCNEYCPALTSDGLPVYRDTSHLNPDYVRTSVRYLDDVLWSGPSLAESH